jgi:hypothetical protein
MPDRDTDPEAEAVVLVMLTVPVCAPALVGSNTTPAVQLAPGASVAGQALLINSKLAGTDTARLLKAIVVEGFVMVSVVGLLVAPMPTAPKLMSGGVT